MPPPFVSVVLSRNVQGQLGEDTAAGYLLDLGWQVLRRHYTCRYGEIDIIAFSEGGLVFVEVKSYKHGSIVSPLTAVTPAKQKRLVHAMQHFLVYAYSAEAAFLRFDLVVATPYVVLEHFQNIIDGEVINQLRY